MNVLTIEQLDPTHTAQFWFFDINMYNICKHTASVCVSPFIKDGGRMLIVNARTLREVNHDLTKLDLA